MHPPNLEKVKVNLPCFSVINHFLIFPISGCINTYIKWFLYRISVKDSLKVTKMSKSSRVVKGPFTILIISMLISAYFSLTVSTI